MRYALNDVCDKYFTCMFRAFGGVLRGFCLHWVSNETNGDSALCLIFVFQYSLSSVLGCEPEVVESLIPLGSRLNSEQNTNAAPLWPPETLVLLRRRISRCVSFTPCRRVWENVKQLVGRDLSYSLWLSVNDTAGIISLNGRGRRCVSSVLVSALEIDFSKSSVSSVRWGLKVC